MQEKTPLRKGSNTYKQYVEYITEANNAVDEANSFKMERKWVEAQLAYERAISSLEKIPVNARSYVAWLKLAQYKADVGGTYYYRQPKQLQLAKKAYNDAVELMESHPPSIKRDDLSRWRLKLSFYYQTLSHIACDLIEWDTAQEKAQKGIGCLVLEETPHPDDAYLRTLAQCQRYLGIAYQNQYQIGLARETFFLAINNGCKIVALGAQEDFTTIAEYLRLIGLTYYTPTLNMGILICARDSLLGNKTANDFFNSLNKAIAPASSIDEKIFSSVLLPVTKFIRSNQHNPNFPNVSLRNLSADHLKQLDALIENLENRKNTVQSLANQSLMSIVLAQEQRIRYLEQKIAILERKLPEAPQIAVPLQQPLQIIAPPQSKPTEKAQATLTQFFGPLQDRPSLETSSRKRKLEKTEETSEGPPAKRANTK
jgi:hypothetical protein